MMRVLSRNSGKQGSGLTAATLVRPQPEPEFYSEFDLAESARPMAPVAKPARAKQPASGKPTTLLTAVWVLAIVFFGFGDTLTSMMVFGAGGVEGNGFMVLALTLLSKLFGNLQAIVGFAAIKVLSTAAVVVTAQAQPKLLWPAGVAMLAVGMFLTAQNTTVLMAL